MNHEPKYVKVTDSMRRRMIDDAKLPPAHVVVPDLALLFDEAEFDMHADGLRLTAAMRCQILARNYLGCTLECDAAGCYHLVPSSLVSVEMPGVIVPPPNIRWAVRGDRVNRRAAMYAQLAARSYVPPFGLVTRPPDGQLKMKPRPFPTGRVMGILVALVTFVLVCLSLYEWGSR